MGADWGKQDEIPLPSHRWVVGRGKKSDSQTPISVSTYDNAVNILVERYEDNCIREEIVRTHPTQLRTYKNFGFEHGAIRLRYFVNGGFIKLKLPDAEDRSRHISTHHLTIGEVHSLAILLDLH